MLRENCHQARPKQRAAFKCTGITHGKVSQMTVAPTEKNKKSNQRLHEVIFQPRCYHHTHSIKHKLAYLHTKQIYTWNTISNHRNPLKLRRCQPAELWLRG